MFFKRKSEGLKAVYAMHTIEGFAYSMIGIFIPIYLLTLGYSLATVLIFYIIHNLSLAVSAIMVGYMTSKLGYKKPLLLRFPVLFAYLILLYCLDMTATPLSIIAILGGLQSALYWTPLNILFAKNTGIKKMGSSIGKLFALPQLSSLVGPLLGGVIAVALGFKFLFIIAFSLLFVSVVPLFKARNIKADFTFQFKKGVQFFKKHPRFILSEIFDNIGGETEGIIWPIFIYLSLANIMAVGVLGALIALGTITFTLIMGQLTDKYNKRLFMKIGVFSLVAVWFLRYFTENEIIYFATTILAGFSLSLLLVPYTTMIFSQAKEDVIDEFFVVKELPSAIGRIAIFLIALLLISNIKLLFPIAGLAYLIFLIL